MSRQTSTTGLPHIDSRGNLIVNRQTSTSTLYMAQSRHTSTTGLLGKSGQRPMTVSKSSTGSNTQLLLDSESDSDMDIEINV